MADKNKNGIPDNKERPAGSLPTGGSNNKNRPAGSTPRGSRGGVATKFRPAMPGSLGPGNKTGIGGAGRGIFTAPAPLRAAPTSVGNAKLNFGETFLPGRGMTLNQYMSRQGQQEEPSMMDTALPSFLQNLMESLGYTGGGGVDYDPLRADARSRGAEYDARIQAMYGQLQDRMRDDGKGIQANYQQAIDSNADRSQAAQQNIQGAPDAAAQRNLQQLQALGIGEAAGNIVAEGRDLNTDTSRAVQDAAARGQISGDNFAQNQQSAATHNTNLVGAAGLEGNLQRSRVQSELQALLSQYDMEEQQAAQQAQQSALSQAMGLAGALTDDQWKSRTYQDDLSRYMAEQQGAQQQAQLEAGQPNKLSQSLQFLKSLMGSPQFEGQNIEQLLPYIQALGGIGKLV